MKNQNAILSAENYELFLLSKQMCDEYLRLWRLISSRLESLLIACDCLFLNHLKNLGQNHRQSICLERLQNQSHFKYSN